MKKEKIDIKHIKIDTTIRKVLLIISIVMLAFGTAGILKSFETVEFENKNQNLYEYTNNFSQNYTVNLKQNQYHLSTENEEQIPDKFKSNDKISKINLNNIRIVKNKLLTSTKIPRINLEEFTSKNNNKEEEQKKELTINADNGRKRYKLKTNIKIESKAAIP